MKTPKYAWRFLIRSKSYTVINLLGLAFSLACCIMLMRYIHRELTVDTHCIDREHVYGVAREMEGDRHLGYISHAKDSIYIDKRYIDKQTSIILLEKDYVVYDHERYSARVLVADSCFFQLFPYQVVQGSSSLNAPESALLTESYAQKLFGKENPIGKVLRYTNGKDVTISGVLAAPHNKTSLQFDVVLSSFLTQRWERLPIEFVKFMPGVNIDLMNKIGSHPRWVNPHYKEYDNRQYTFSFIPVGGIYWNNVIVESAECPTMLSSGNSSHIYILSGVCALLLLVGIINFVNIYLIFMMMRSKEYGIKKVFGLSRGTLFLQIWTENFLIACLALLIAWFIIEIISMPIARLLNAPFPYTSFDVWLSLTIIMALPLLTSLYPFIKYSCTPPTVSIRNISTSFRSVRIRMIFLSVQYILTFLLITLSLYFNKQLSVLLHTNPGFRTENILIAKLIYESSDMNTYRSPDAREAQRKRKQEIGNALSQCPFIECWYSNYENILSPTFNVTYQNSKGEKATLKHEYVSPDFFKLYGIKVVEGEMPEYKDNEDDRRKTIAVNRSALKALHYDNLDGAMIIEDYKERNSTDATMIPISTIVEDYYNGHLCSGIQPTIFEIYPIQSGDLFQISYTPGRLSDLLKFLRDLEYRIYGSETFEYSLLENDVKAIYQKDKQVATIYIIFSGTAIAISCLGLFGISLFDIRQRYREIGIRKINGAQLNNLYSLLFRKYMVVLGIAFLLATPLAYYTINEYTRDFAVKAPLSIGIFAIGLTVVTFISMSTLFWQIRKAANINPASIMKNE